MRRKNGAKLIQPTPFQNEILTQLFPLNIFENKRCIIKKSSKKRDRNYIKTIKWKIISQSWLSSYLEIQDMTQPDSELAYKNI